MKLKIGDKVRIIKNSYDWTLGSEGVLTEVRPPEGEYHYRGIFYDIHTKKSFHYPLRDDEVEKIVTKNQQLLFSFMNEL